MTVLFQDADVSEHSGAAGWAQGPIGIVSSDGRADTLAALGISSTAGRTHSFQQWSARFVRNLYSDGQPMVRDRTLLEHPLYRAIRQRVVRHRLQQPVIVTIQLVHTGIFLVIMGFVVQATLSGIRDRIGRWTAVSTVVVIGEGLVLGLNGGRCPLTIVVEDMGDEHGSVSDIFLPDWAARHIAHLTSGLLLLGLIALIVRRAVRAVRATSSSACNVDVVRPSYHPARL